MKIRKEALYYKKLDDRKVKCYLCPHGCVIKEGNIGICRVRENVDGKLFTSNYGQITSCTYDPIEKKPLYHFYPGSNILSVGTFGCNLKCAFCQNWQIAHDKPHTLEVDSTEIISRAAKHNSIGIAYTYNEPSIWYEFVLDTAIKAKFKGIKNVLVTNGYIEEGPLKELLPYIDAMNIDVKGFSKKYYKNICSGDLQSVLNTVEIASSSVFVEVTTLIVEELNDDLRELEELFKWLAKLDKGIPLHLTRYYPQYKMTNPPTNIDTLMEAKELANKYLDYIYVGNVWGFDNNTNCPECGNLIVDRTLKINAVGLDGTKCAKCGYEINIVV